MNSVGKDNNRPILILGTRGSAAAYAVRDFLTRSDVRFDWIELVNDEEAPQGRPCGRTQ